MKGSSSTADASIPFALNTDINAAEVNPAIKQRLAAANIDTRNPILTNPHTNIIEDVRAESRSEFRNIFFLFTPFESAEAKDDIYEDTESDGTHLT